MIAENVAKPSDDGCDDSRLLTMGDLSQQLRVSIRQTRYLKAQGLLPEPIMLGRSERWSAPEIGEWIKARCPSRKAWETMQNGQRGSDS